MDSQYREQREWAYPNSCLIVRAASVTCFLLVVLSGEFAVCQTNEVESNKQQYSILEGVSEQAAAPTSPAASTPITPDQKPTSPAADDEATQADDSSSDQLNRLLTQIVLDHMPHEFVEDKDWGQQDERWDGLRVRREGLRLKTKRRKKMVNHGKWQKYSAELIDPDKQFSIEVKNTHATDDDRVAFDVVVLAKLNLHGRQSQWVKGVQLYSLSADGHADVQMVASIELGTSLDITKFPPDLIFDPKIVDAQLELTDFRIDRVSKAGGEFAQQLSRRVRSTLERKIDDKEVKLVQKLNEKIDKKRNKLRLSVHDALNSKWVASAKELLPADVKEAFEGDDE